MSGNHFASAALLGVMLLLLIVSWLGSRHLGDFQLRLQARRGRRLMSVPAVKNMPESDGVADIQTLAERASTRRRWIDLSELLGALEEETVRAPDGRRLHDVAVDAAILRLRTANDLTTLTERLEDFEGAAATGEKALLLLHARAAALALRLAQERFGVAGAEYARTCARRIDSIVAALGEECACSPSLAEAVYHASAVLNDDPAALQQAFRFWQIVDPGNPRAYVHHAARLAALGEQTEAELVEHLAETTDTLAAHGPQTLLMTHLAVARTRPIWQIPDWDPEVAYWQLGRVASGPNGQLLVNCFAQKLLEDGLETVAIDVVRNYLTHWVTPIWPDKLAFEALFWRAMSQTETSRTPRSVQAFDHHRVMA